MAFAAKRDSPPISKSCEFSGQKREFIARESLVDMVTQMAGISNLISSYVVEAPKDNSLKSTLLAGNSMRREKE
jgi:hypothetical protein